MSAVRQSGSNGNVDSGGEPGGARAVVQRRCLVTGAVSDRAGLVRFVAAPDGRIVPDVADKLPGRGLWVGARRELVDRAAVHGHFRRALGAARRGGDAFLADPALSDRVEALLARRCLDLLGLARRARLVVVGFEAVRAAVAAGQAAVVILAADGRGAGKLGRVMAAVTPPPAVVAALRGDELGGALGRHRVAYAALRAGGLSARFLAESGRLAGFRDGPDLRDPAANAERHGTPR